MASPSRLLDAAYFAARRHRDQRRKDADASPYINHPLAVARVLATVGGLEDETLLVAALLHDTIEDTETTADELAARFGADVAKLIGEVTDDKSLPKAERKRRQVAATPGTSVRARQLRIADKICNVADLASSPPAGWSAVRKLEYLDWAAAVVAGCRGVSPALETRFDEVLDAARRALAADGP